MQVTAKLKRISHAATCVLLSAVLASGVFVSNALSSKVEDAHAVAFVLPAAAAAVGMDSAAFVAAGAAICATVTGFSLASYVGATETDVHKWTPEELGKGLDFLNDVNDEICGKLTQDDLDKLYLDWCDYATWGKEPGGGDGQDPKPDPPKDPKDYNSSPFWRAIVLANTGFMGLDALGWFAEGIKNVMSLNGSLEETINYPDCVVHLGNNDYSIPVRMLSDYSLWSDDAQSELTSKIPSGFYPFCFYENPSGYLLFRLVNGINAISSISVRGDTFDLIFGSGESNFYICTYYPSNPDGHKFSIGTPYSQTGNIFSFHYLTPQGAILLDKTYTNATTLDNKHEIADAPQSISGLDIDTIKDYLKQIGTTTGTGTTTVLKLITTVVNKTYADNLTETETKLEPVTPKPDSPPTVITPDWYDFPNSWNDGSIKWNRVFPFFFLDDLAQLFDKWFPVTEYKSKFSITVPSFWGTGGGKTITIDFAPFERFRPFVYYGSLSLIFVALLARLYTWWGGFKTDDS